MIHKIGARGQNGGTSYSHLNRISYLIYLRHNIGDRHKKRRLNITHTKKVLYIRARVGNF